jgi:hypothetical protein
MSRFIYETWQEIGKRARTPSTQFLVNCKISRCRHGPERNLPACRLPGTISGSCWALVEPGPSAQIHCTIKLRRTPPLYGDRRGILADPISGTAVLEYGATEILPPVGAIL